MGDINVYTGPMKCGKSNKIIEEAKRQMIAGKQIKIFKPQIDTRFAEDYITDRNGNKLKSVNINNIEDIKNYDADVYVIDEFQFLDGNVNCIEEMAESGKKFYIAGLNLTSERKPFGKMGDLLCVSDNVQTMTSICEICRRDNAVFSYYKAGKKNGDIKLGDLEYIPVCRNCYNELNKNKNELESGIKSIESGISTAKSEIEKAKNKISNGKKELQKQENTLNASKKEAQTKIENAKKELEQSKEKIKNGEEELERSKNEYNQKINDAEKELIDAKSKIADIESPKWYIFDRYNNDGYNSYIQDTHSIKNLGNVFPIVFFIVATLISLNTMTRMVEEQRAQIGTLKALGYNKFQIISKYVIYATLATVIGGILGMCVGFVLIPTIIFKMYQMMYQISGFKAEFNMFYGMLGLGLISICIIGATIYSALKELGNTPATLMRPKSPKIGKRVLLEHIPFIWKRLSFTRKVTVRNIFRYKKRFLMTIIGILGCTALIVTGFGLKNTIKSIIPLEYENVFNYDMQITLKSGNDENQKDKYIQELKNKDEIEKVVATYMTSVTAQKDDKSESLIMIVPDDENKLEGLINIKDVKTKNQVSLKENEICITDKVAQLLNVKQGDTVKIKDLDDNEIDVKVSNIVENYVYHYAYMSKQTYQNLFKKDYSTNILFAKNKELSEEKINELSKAIMNDNEVSGVSVISNLTSQIDNMMSSLNYVVIILIVSAGLLAFVVLYNLQNVNISERIRELATIKVLGFYDKEVYSYVARETILLTIIGTILGLIGGYFLNAFILKTCEINMLRFKPTIEPISYIYAIALTTGFSIIVNIATYFALKKIDMIESLKSGE